jgi:uridine phosphorylase
MIMRKLSEADLILNPDGSIYHLNLLPEDIAGTIITVGDPDRINEITRHFDKIELKKGKREFLTQTGYIGQQRLTVISTGIGTDNIDIVMNELDALVNIDFKTRLIKDKLSSLNIVRIGTSGAIQPDLPIGTILASSYGLGMDALMYYYVHETEKADIGLFAAVQAHFSDLKAITPYLYAADPGLLRIIGQGMEQGITATEPGFYAPQGRHVRAETAIPDLIERLNTFRYTHYRITNLEMETAGIYALAKILGHKALSINAILASRVNDQFSNEPGLVVDKAIKLVLERIVTL